MPSVFLQLGVALAIYLVFVLLDSVQIAASHSLLFVVFWWTSANLGGAQAPFYLAGLFFIMIIVFARFDEELGVPLKINNSEFSVGDTALSNLQSQLLFLGMGVIIFLVMVAVQAGRPEGATILGTPTLSISKTSFLSGFDTFLEPTLSGLLGIIENRAFYLLFLIFSALPLGFLLSYIPFGVGDVLEPIADFIIAAFFTAVGFAFFHLKYYGLNVASLVFAGGIMLVWLVTILYTKDMTPSDTAHWLWNVVQTAKDKLGVVI